MKDLKIALQNHTKSCNKRFNTFQQNLVESLETANQNVAPNVDSLGRLHAPVHGYLGGDFYDTLYGKGQFIPMPEQDFDTFFGNNFPTKTFSDRITIATSIIESIKESSKYDGIEISFGKEYVKNGIACANAYIKGCNLTYIKIAKEILQKTMNSIKPVAVEKGEAPIGRQTIKATVLTTKLFDGFYGMEYKMMVELENNSTVYGSVPSSLGIVECGVQIQFTATFSHATDDNTHAFFKRPSKATTI